METTTHKLIVMGVSGCGKSTLGAGMALALGCPLIEGDAFHPPARTDAPGSLQDGTEEHGSITWASSLPNGAPPWRLARR
jgi:hypothetical protein